MAIISFFGSLFSLFSLFFQFLSVPFSSFQFLSVAILLFLVSFFVLERKWGSLHPLSFLFFFSCSLGFLSLFSFFNTVFFSISLSVFQELNQWF